MAAAPRPGRTWHSVRWCVAWRVDRFLADGCRGPRTDWGGFLRLKCSKYNARPVVKGVLPTRVQMKIGLPAPGVAGRVRAMDFARPGMEPFLRDPSRSVKPPERWPPRLKRAKGRARPGKWQNILEGPHSLSIVRFIEEKDLVYWQGEPLLNGAFGLPKGDLTAPDFSVDT